MRGRFWRTNVRAILAHECEGDLAHECEGDLAHECEGEGSLE